MMMKGHNFRYLARNFTVDINNARKVVAIEKQLEKEWMMRPESSALFERWLQSVPHDHIHQENLLMHIRTRGTAGEVEDNSPTFRVLSSLLSNPLTLAYGLRSVFLQKMKNIKVLGIGMRSESQLPINWWRETIIAGVGVDEIEFEMVGPDMTPKHNITRCVFQSKKTGKISQLMLSAPSENKILFHNQKSAREKLLNTNVIILFNPGFGANDIMRHQWRETLVMLLLSRKPIICTAHSEADLARDTHFIHELAKKECGLLEEQFEFILPPHTNPFRSHSKTFDPNEPKANFVVSTNHSIYAIRMK